jgi:hypothetical protein
MTGWTWAHVSDTVTLPQVHVLQTFWQHQPPMVVLAGRLCRYLGIDVGTAAKPAPITKPQEAMQELAKNGFPVMEGRPDDPMLDLLDL